MQATFVSEHWKEIETGKVIQSKRRRRLHSRQETGRREKIKIKIRLDLNKWMSIIIEQFINIYAPGLQNPSIDTSAQILVCFLPVLIDKLIFFFTIYNGQRSFNISNPTAGARGREQAFVFGYVTITEGLHRTYLIESSIQI